MLPEVCIIDHSGQMQHLLSDKVPAHTLQFHPRALMHGTHGALKDGTAASKPMSTLSPPRSSCTTSVVALLLVPSWTWPWTSIKFLAALEPYIASTPTWLSPSIQGGEKIPWRESCVATKWDGDGEESDHGSWSSPTAVMLCASDGQAEEAPVKPSIPTTDNYLYFYMEQCAKQHVIGNIGVAIHLC
jgi:hypothetical protein